MPRKAIGHGCKYSHKSVENSRIWPNMTRENIKDTLECELWETGLTVVPLQAGMLYVLANIIFCIIVLHNILFCAKIRLSIQYKDEESEAAAREPLID